jgi:hypothetical protein
VREFVPLALLAVACASMVRGPAGCRRALPDVTSASAAANSSPSIDAGSTPPAAARFDSMAARASTLAPGMREVARKESAGERVEVARATARDACVRVAFEAAEPVVAKLVDGEGNVLAASERAVTEGVLGAAGPVCVRKGDSVSAIAEGVGASVRWVAWEAP